jgi:hypothetical protein
LRHALRKKLRKYPGLNTPLGKEKTNKKHEPRFPGEKNKEPEIPCVFSHLAQKDIFSAFESAPWIPSAVEPACGATKSHLP